MCCAAGAITKIILPQPRIELDPSTGKPFTRSSPSSTHVEEKRVTTASHPSRASGKKAVTGSSSFRRSNLAREEEKEVRRNFWYREALFSRLSGAWRTLPTVAQACTLSQMDLSREELRRRRGSKRTRPPPRARLWRRSSVGHLRAGMLAKRPRQSTPRIERRRTSARRTLCYRPSQHHEPSHPPD